MVVPALRCALGVLATADKQNVPVTNAHNLTGSMWLLHGVAVHEPLGYDTQHVGVRHPVLLTYSLPGTTGAVPLTLQLWGLQQRQEGQQHWGWGVAHAEEWQSQRQRCCLCHLWQLVTPPPTGPALLRTVAPSCGSGGSALAPLSM